MVSWRALAVVDKANLQRQAGQALARPGDGPYRGRMDSVIDKIDWVPGDHFGLAVPAHISALRERGEDFLTEAFRASRTLATDNAVVQVTRFDELSVGGTGCKLILSVRYARPQAVLPCDLFVKFSRDFSDPRRDRSRYMLDAEVRFALLSRDPEFPIAVPLCLFADYHAESGTGLLITERIAYGHDGIEPHYAKCLDTEMPEPLAHYQALVTTLGRLSGTHKAGRMPARTDTLFPFDAEYAAACDRIPYTAQQLQNRVARYEVFATNFPHMLPPNIRAPGFIKTFRDEVVRFSEREGEIQAFLQSVPDFIALCHWNANIDNCWFWRGKTGARECGLLDWGRVGQMSIARTLYGGLSGAEPALWAAHVDDLLALFAAEYRRCGGPEIDVDELMTHVDLVTATMGLAYLMDVPPIVQIEFPDLVQITGPGDPRFVANENARVMLHMLTMFLNRWETRDFGAVLTRALGP